MTIGQDITNITLIMYISNLVIGNCSEGFSKKLDRSKLDFDSR